MLIQLEEEEVDVETKTKKVLIIMHPRMLITNQTSLAMKNKRMEINLLFKIMILAT